LGLHVEQQNALCVLFGVTNGLLKPVAQHRAGEVCGFTQQYHCTYLVYFEQYRNIRDAIVREKQLKGWRQEKKMR
jgi:putative endonuclease